MPLSKRLRVYGPCDLFLLKWRSKRFFNKILNTKCFWRLGLSLPKICHDVYTSNIKVNCNSNLWYGKFGVNRILVLSRALVRSCQEEVIVHVQNLQLICPMAELTLVSRQLILLIYMSWLYGLWFKFVFSLNFLNQFNLSFPFSLF